MGVLNKEMDKLGGAPSVAGSEQTTKMLKMARLRKNMITKKHRVTHSAKPVYWHFGLIHTIQKKVGLHWNYYRRRARVLH